MRFGISLKTFREDASCIFIAAKTGIGFAQVPKDRAVARIQFPRLLEVCDRLRPAALAPVDRAGSVPDLGIVRSSLMGDGDFRAGQFVVAIAKIVVVGERQPRIAQIGLESQCVVRGNLCLSQARSTSIIPKPIQLAVDARSQAMRERELRVPLD